MPEMTLDSIAAREIAEWAASLRSRGGDPQYFIAQPGRSAGNYSIRNVSMRAEPVPPQPGPATVVVPCSTAAVQPGRPSVTGIQIQAEGMPATQWESLMQYDAVFWTEAAVEKFLFPYYASKYQWAAAHVLTAMARVFYGYVPGPAGPAGSDAPWDDNVPIAMAHLPRSDYTAIEDPHQTANIARDLVVLFLDRSTGGLVHRPLSEFL